RAGMHYHLVARTWNGVPAFRSTHDAWRLWGGLREAWPNALAACLMPNHAHLIVEAEPSELRITTGRYLAGFKRYRNLRRLWAPVPEPEPIRDSKRLSRQFRYVILNPCRAGLVADPLCWSWSTY